MNESAHEHLGREGGLLGAQLLRRGWRVTSAESCTAGLLAWALTETAGSSHWFEQGVVTYSNEAKGKLLNVSAATLSSFGAVSEPCALEMAQGALASAGADLALSVTGIAGPGGGSADKPVGTVCFAAALRNGIVQTQTCHFSGDRTSVRQQAALQAIRLGLRCIQQTA
jgi:nicotinamide-nucleotide amidase